MGIGNFDRVGVAMPEINLSTVAGKINSKTMIHKAFQTRADLLALEKNVLLPGRSIGYPMLPPSNRTCGIPAYVSSASALFTELKIKRVSPFGA